MGKTTTKFPLARNKKENTCKRNIANFLSLNKDFKCNELEDDPKIIRAAVETLLLQIENRMSQCSVDGEKSRQRNWVEFQKAIFKDILQDSNELEEARNFMQQLGGSEAELVIEKKLTDWDVDFNQDQLVMPMAEALSKYFSIKVGTFAQKELGVNLFVLPSPVSFGLLLAQCNMDNRNYVLKCGWSKVVEENGLKEGTRVQLWSFLVQRNLCLVLVPAGCGAGCGSGDCDGHTGGENIKLVKQVEVDHPEEVEPSADLCNFISAMGGSKPELVIEKTLRGHDNYQLVMPVEQILNSNFLKQLKLGSERCLGVHLYVEPYEESVRLLLSQCNISGELNYVLKSGWRTVVEDNGLKKNNRVQLWSFMVGNDLRFVLVVLGGLWKGFDGRRSCLKLKEPPADPKKEAQAAQKSYEMDKGKSIVEVKKGLQKCQDRYDNDAYDNDATTSDIKRVKVKVDHRKTELPVDVRDFIMEMGGSEPELVIEKRLTRSDILRSQGRLLMPLQGIEEQEILPKEDEVSEEVRLFVRPRREHHKARLTRWNMSGTRNYVFKCGWTDVVEKNGLEENMRVQVWGFLVDQMRCFVIVRVGAGEGVDGVGGDDPGEGHSGSGKASCSCSKSSCSKSSGK